MPDVNFQITTPTLTAGQKFITRYRLLPAGAWSSYVDRTNAAFTITGLTAGEYELEAILVLADETQCAPTYWKFTVVDPVECIDFVMEIIQNSNGQYFLHVDYSLPSPVYNPPCGWIITHANGSTTYPTLPTPPILIPTQNVAQVVTVTADGCTGNRKLCFEGDIDAIDEPCAPMTITGVEVVVNNVYPNGFYGMTLYFSYTQSNPVTNAVNVTITQTNTVLAGVPSIVNVPIFPVTVVGNPIFGVPIAVNNQIFGNTYTFAWVVVDGCGVSHKGTATKVL